MTAAPLLPYSNGGGFFLNMTKLLSQTDITGHSRAPRFPDLRQKCLTKERTKERQGGRCILWRAQPAFFTLALLPLSLIPPRSQRSHPANLRVPQEGQNCRGSPHVIKHQQHSRSPRCPPLTQSLNPPPHDSRLAGPRWAPGNEVESGLPLAGVAPPAHTCRSQSCVSCPEDMTQSLRGRVGTGSTVQPTPF